ncbi:MAG: transcription factor [Nitrososphaerota archaeon]
MSKVEFEDSFVKLCSILGGDEYVKVARALLSTEGVTDEEVASSTGLKINAVRRILYDLHGRTLIKGIRTKDPKKGWTIYRWKADRDQVESYIEGQKHKILMRLRERLRYESEHRFYHCGAKGHPVLEEEEAIDSFYTCPTCGNVLQQVDNSEMVRALGARIAEIEKELKLRPRA